MLALLFLSIFQGPFVSVVKRGGPRKLACCCVQGETLGGSVYFLDKRINTFSEDRTNEVGHMFNSGDIVAPRSITIDSCLLSEVQLFGDVLPWMDKKPLTLWAK